MANTLTNPIDPVFTRREMLATTGMAGLAALTGIASGAVAQTTQKRPRIACLVSYWGATRSHADWIVTKLLDGYWWQGAHTPSRVDVVSVYIHQREESGLGQKVCKSKGIPIFNTVGEAVMLGGRNLRSMALSSSENTASIQPTSKGSGSCHAGGSISRS